MDMLTIFTLAAQSPVTGDNFPTIPLIFAGGIAVVIAILSTVLALKKKKDDDDE